MKTPWTVRKSETLIVIKNAETADEISAINDVKSNLDFGALICHLIIGGILVSICISFEYISVISLIHVPHLPYGKKNPTVLHLFLLFSVCLYLWNGYLVFIIFQCCIIVTMMIPSSNKWILGMQYNADDESGHINS